MPTKEHSSMAPPNSSDPASVNSGPPGTDGSPATMEVDDRIDRTSDEEDEDEDEDPPTFGKFPRNRVLVSTEVAARSNTNTRRGRYERRHQESHRVAKPNTRSVNLDNLPYLTAKLKKVLEDGSDGQGGDAGDGSASKERTGSDHLEKSYHLLDGSGGPEGPNGVDQFIEAFNQAKTMKEEHDAVMKRGHYACVKGDGEGKEGGVPRCRHSSSPVDQAKEGEGSKSS